MFALDYVICSFIALNHLTSPDYMGAQKTHPPKINVILKTDSVLNNYSKREFISHLRFQLPTVSFACKKRSPMTSSAEQEDHCYISAFSLRSKINKSCVSGPSQILGVEGSTSAITTKAKLFKCFNN